MIVQNKLQLMVRANWLDAIIHLDYPTLTYCPCSSLLHIDVSNNCLVPYQTIQYSSKLYGSNAVKMVLLHHPHSSGVRICLIASDRP